MTARAGGDEAEFKRYAIYYAPPCRSALARFGAAWLGWDAAAGKVVPHPDMPGLSPSAISILTATPRRYGFHGTLKPPFRLAPDRTVTELEDALARFAAAHPPVVTAGLRLARLGRFLALVPKGDTVRLDALTADCVEEFESFRAPLSKAEIARRESAGLTDRQRAYLHKFGYPYVREEFRFHLTLTGALDSTCIDKLARENPTCIDKSNDDLGGCIDNLENLLRSGLESHLEPDRYNRFEMAEICLFGDPGEGRNFRLLSRHSLSG